MKTADTTESYTIRWTSPTGEIKYPANAVPLSYEMAQAGLDHGSVWGWRGEIVTWKEYEERDK